MSSLTLHPSAPRATPPDPAAEAARLETLLAARRAELTALQTELRAFKTRYAQIVGRLLAELAEVEQEIEAAERRLAGQAAEPAEAANEAADETAAAAAAGPPVRASLRKLFWSVAKLFHPDHAADERESRRRHAIMAEASRAYHEGDVASLHTLLGDDQLQSYCAMGAVHDEAEDALARLPRLKDELRTIEFGLKRIQQDSLYRLMLTAHAAAARGHDTLTDTAASLERQLRKARHRLAHLV